MTRRMHPNVRFTHVQLGPLLGQPLPPATPRLLPLVRRLLRRLLPRLENDKTVAPRRPPPQQRDQRPPEQGVPLTPQLRWQKVPGPDHPFVTEKVLPELSHPDQELPIDARSRPALTEQVPLPPFSSQQEQVRPPWARPVTWEPELQVPLAPEPRQPLPLKLQ